MKSATRRRDLPRLRIIREYAPDREAMLAAVRFALRREVEREVAAEREQRQVQPAAGAAEAEQK